MRSTLIAGISLVWVGCNDTKLAVYNTPPTASIIAPTGGETYTPGDLVELSGLARDDQDNSEDLEISWSSSLDGVLGEEPADTNGDVYLALTDLSTGDHAITLTVADSSGDTSTASVEFTIAYDGENNEGAPTVTFEGPTSGDTFYVDEDVTFVATVSDEEQAWDTLSTTLKSSRDGVFWTGNPATDGTVSEVYAALSVGEHVITLTAEDDDSNVASDTRTIEVLGDDPPEVTITAPIAGDVFSTDQIITFEGEVTDDVTESDEIAVVWESDVDGEIGSGNPDSTGYTVVTAELSETAHVVTLTATDALGEESSATVTIDVVDPLNYDDDGDGWTENEGDCDDDDATVYPEAEELCDDVDNDCDGDINEDFWDAYESNDDTSSPYDLGDVDAFLWDSETVTLSGLNIHAEDDGDYFQFDAGDDYWENVYIEVEVTTPATSGDYTLVLYMDDGGWQVQQSDSGVGTLSVEYDGSRWDEDEDDFIVAVYATSWPTDTCEEDYEIFIEATTYNPW